MEVEEKMKICEIYAKYGIPENLQMHMLRVAACSQYILDHWTGEPLQEKAVIRVSLLHDMGNLVKMPEDFSDNPTFPYWLYALGIDYLCVSFFELRNCSEITCA